MGFQYSSEERIQWLKSLHPRFIEQTWHNDVVAHFSHIHYKQFFKRAGTFKEKIDPSKIYGIDYSYGYNCIMYKPKEWRYYWINFFTELRRLDRIINNFKTKDEVIKHIHQAKEAKTVEQYGNHYFTIGGQHRLCLAKFLEVPEVEVNVVKYVLDREMFIREMNFQKLIPNLKDAGFLKDNYEIEHSQDFVFLNFVDESVYIKKHHVGYLLQRYKILKKMPFKGYLNYIKSLNSSSHDKGWINSEEKLYLLDSYILKHQKLKNKPVLED